MLTEAERDRLVVVLVGTRNPLNIGAAARAMSNFGFSQLRLVRPWAPALTEVQSAVGAEQLLAAAQQFSTLSEAIADCALVAGTTGDVSRECFAEQRPITPLAATRQIASALAAEERAALVFGPEKTGLANDELDHCNLLVRIPTREAHSSMNLGQSVAVCLYELIRGPSDQPDLNRAPVHQAAPQEALERLARFLHQALAASGYIAPGAEDATEAKVRRLVRRLAPGQKDADLLLGMLRKIAWRSE